jgi:hypothetical protein
MGGPHGDGPFVVPRGHGHWGGPWGWALCRAEGSWALGGPIGMGIGGAHGEKVRVTQRTLLLHVDPEHR